MRFFCNSSGTNGFLPLEGCTVTAGLGVLSGILDGIHDVDVHGSHVDTAATDEGQRGEEKKKQVKLRN